MGLSTRYVFRGDPRHRPKLSNKDSPEKQEPYIPDSDLIKAVNLAIYLRRPLLLEGEAGCGKTRLASAVAYELGLPFYRWDVRSTSKAQDGLYRYDAIRRLHDVQVQKIDSTLPQNPSDSKAYRSFGALGKAFISADCPAVVLIDEIDKADLDFPNDLLAVLDEPWQFEIAETQETIQANHQPIVIITSNKEKGNLPTPFLRRCIYCYVSFPNDPKRLEEIVQAHYQAQSETLPDISPPSSNLVEAASERFLAVRQAGDLYKNPGTSEFLDWLEVLRGFDQKPYSASKLKKQDPVPYPELLFKLRDDWRRHATV